MKKGFYFLMKTVLVLGLFFAVGCGKDDDNSDKNNDGGSNNGNNNKENPNTPVADPVGTLTLSVRNGDNGNTGIPVYNSNFGIDNGNNFIGHYGGEWRFASFGAVKGLGNVTQIPDNGWSSTLAVTPGHGYVAMCLYNDTWGVSKITFARVYVEDWTLAAGSNGIIGARIKYQYPFNGTATSIGLTQNSVTLVPNGNSWHYEYHYKSSSLSLNKVSYEIENIRASNYSCYGEFSFDGSKVKLVIEYNRIRDWRYDCYENGEPHINPIRMTISPGLQDGYIMITPPALEPCPHEGDW